MTALRAAALGYAAAGLPVFPCRARDKEPLGGHGFKDATADLEQVARWWRRWPNANIGIPTGPASGWFVVDLDGPEGAASWAGLVDQHGPVETLEQQTGNGRHLVFAYPSGLELRNRGGKAKRPPLGRGIDTRGSGGYILAAPSVHPSGRLYRWRWPGEEDPGGSGQGALEPSPRPPWVLPRAPAPLPSWIVERLTWTPPPPLTRAYPPASSDGAGLVRFVAQQDRGNRNAGLFWATCRALEQGLGGDVLDALRLAAVRTGLSDTEAVQTIASARGHVGGRGG